MTNLIKRHPVITYFTITFVWTWSIVAAMIFSGQVDVNTPSLFFILGGLICNISPSIAAFIVTRVTEGKEGVRRLRSGFSNRGTISLRSFAILTVPAITGITALISSHTFRSNQLQFTAPLIAMGLIWPLFSGFGEEFGWRGYILPKMIAKFGLLKAGILLGLIWETWHIPMHYMSYQNYGEYLIPAFLVIGFINLTLQSVIMAYIFTKSNGSIFLMILYHFTITSSCIILGAFFQMDPSPKLSVCEGIISVALFLVFALFLYVGRKEQPALLKEEKVC